MVDAMGVEWQVALAAVFVEGLLFLVLAAPGIRGALLRAILAFLTLAVLPLLALLLILFHGLR